ncbi:MAG: phosphomevalonate kinase [Candidatus Diapherotrites archaeon]|nr:phosphomevalonate kinase [Candidatus Diapherotrites archaeon]
MKELTVSAPGKLMLSGEWSVLELGASCIVMAIDKRVYAKVHENSDSKIIINAPDVGLSNLSANFDPLTSKLVFEKELSKEELDKVAFTKNAIELSLAFIQGQDVTLKGFSLETRSDDAQVKLDDGSVKKVGFGSSAAVTVAIAGAVFALHGQDINSYESKETIFKISALAHFLAQGKLGSSFDIAASSFGGVLFYKKFDPEWVVAEYNKTYSVYQLMLLKWPYLAIKPLKIPQDFNLAVGWTKTSASTKELIAKINEFKKSNKADYDAVINKIKNLTTKLVPALESGNHEEVLKLLKENRKHLKEFSDLTLNNLETAELKILADTADSLGGAGKFSGAGGGDCGIAVSFSTEIAEKIKQEWKQKGLYPLDVKISQQGLRLE